jgi:hypothetical protein
MHRAGSDDLDARAQMLLRTRLQAALDGDEYREVVVFYQGQSHARVVWRRDESGWREERPQYKWNDGMDVNPDVSPDVRCIWLYPEETSAARAERIDLATAREHVLRSGGAVASSAS